MTSLPLPASRSADVANGKSWVAFARFISDRQDLIEDLNSSIPSGLMKPEESINSIKRKSIFRFEVGLGLAPG